ncbi:MAG: DUF1178 family protein [Beijerinckiaceae bacterium]|nr:DUF1178 family protein [Beijerinckiaceae bacterium]
MIRYALVCENGHDFESWFSDSGAYEKQAKRGFVECPHCHSTKVQKALMAPAVSTSKRRARNDAIASPADVAAPASDAPQPVAIFDEKQRALREAIRELHAKITENTDDVGAQFLDEARRMHQGETPTRAIRGQASLAEAKELWDEGIPVLPLPTLPDERN